MGEESFAKHRRCVVAVDPRYFRPTEVDMLLRDPSKARTRLGWQAKTTFRQFVAGMIREDLKSAERDELVNKSMDTRPTITTSKRGMSAGRPRFVLLAGRGRQKALWP